MTTPDLFEGGNIRPSSPGLRIYNTWETDWQKQNLSDGVQQGLLSHGDAPPAITDALVDNELFVTPHTIWELMPAAATTTNTLEFSFTPVAFGVSLPNEIGVHRAIGTLPAAGAFPAGLPAGVIGISYATRLQRLYLWTSSELIDRKQSWGIVIGNNRHNLRYQDMPEYGGTNVFRYAFVFEASQPAPFATGTAVTMRLVAPGPIFTAPSARHWAHYLDVSDPLVFDDTMAGAGTEQDPRRVARPFTAADAAQLGSFRHEGREEWSAVITNGSSTPGQWGSNATSRGYGVAPPGDTDTAFGSITDNTIETVLLYALFQNSTGELIMWVHGDQTWNANFLEVDDHQFHFSTAEYLNTTDTGGPESIYTWRNGVPADLFGGASTVVSVSTPLSDADYVQGLPDAELEYYGTPRGWSAGTPPTWNSLAVQELPQLVTALPYHPAVGALRRISGVVTYPDTIEMTVGAATAGASTGEFDDQTVGTLTLERLNIYAGDYSGQLASVRAGKVFAVFSTTNNAIAGASLFLDGTTYAITPTWLDAANSQHEHDIPTLTADALSPGTYRVQFIQGDDQSPADKSIGRAGNIVSVKYSARDTWVYDGFAPLTDDGFVDRNFLPIVVLTQAAYDALVAAGNVDPNVFYFIQG